MSVSKALAALLVIVFVILGLFIILTWSVERDLLNADVYVETLDEAGFFELPYQLIREGDIPGAGGILLTEGPLSVVSGPQLEAVARELAPPDWLRAQLERGVRDVLAVAEAPEVEELPALVISLSEVKARALSEPGDRALNIVISALPQCVAGQVPLDMARAVPVCVPADLNVPVFTGELKTLLTPYVERVPDTYRVQWQPEQQDALQDLQRAGRTLDQLRVALLLLVALSAALLALIWLLAVRSPAEWLRWTGAPLLLLGGLALVAGWLPPRLIETGLERADLWSEASVPVAVGETMEQTVLALTETLFQPAVMVGLLLVVVGLALTLVSPLFPGRQARHTTAPY